ncbi:MAG: DivIVA domain-containing protein [Methanomassiliicoccales archaeon]
MTISKQLGFKHVFWGFKPSQVRQELFKMAESQQEVTCHYQQQIELIENELKSLTEKTKILQGQLQQYQQQEILLAETLITAQAEANQITGEARQEADAIIYAAHDEINHQRLMLQAVEQQQALFINEFGKLYSQLMQKCSLVMETTPEPLPLEITSAEQENCQSMVLTDLNDEIGGGEVH